MTPYFDILFSPIGVTLRAPQNATVLEVAQSGGVPLTADCGGNGTCGKCVVEVLRGPEPGRHPACQLRVQGGMHIRIPQKGAERLLSDAATAYTAFTPSLRCHAVSSSPRDKEDCRSEWELLLDGVPVDTPTRLSTLSFLDAKDSIYALFCDNELLQFCAHKPVYHMAAIDTGTTSLVCYLLDGQTGNELSVASIQNPQAAFGADVINRIHYSLSHEGNDLHTVLIQAINALLAEACRNAAVPTESVCLLAVGGNTCMHHFLLALPLASLATAPYRPAFRHSLTLAAGSLGLAAHPHAKLRVLPNIAGFVGADTVAGLIATDLAMSDELTLLIDIGTNGEMVLGDKRGRTACSAAAGPAFEGAHIRCGMRGATGAIDHVRLHGNQPHYTVIGNGAPQGLCGSGLVDLVATLLDAGIIGADGRFSTNPDWEPRMTIADGQKAFRLVDNVILTQQDIRQLQLAKAAMAAGIRLLCAERGVLLRDIRRVAIAGAFGNYLDPRSACRIGLLPAELLPCVQSIGNAAGEGVKRVLRDPALWRQADELAFGTRYLELAACADFQDYFVSELNFPEKPL